MRRTQKRLQTTIKTWSYQKKLVFVFGTLTVLVIILFNTLGYFREAGYVREQVNLSLKQGIAQTAKNIDSQMEFLDNLTFSVAGSRQAIADMERYLVGDPEAKANLQTSLDAILGSWKEVSGIYLYTEQDKWVASSRNNAILRQFRLNQELWYRKIQDCSHLIYVDRGSVNMLYPQQQNLSVLRKIYNLDTELTVGYIKADMDLDYFVETSLEAPDELGLNFYGIVDEEGQIQLSTKGDFGLDQMNFVLRPTEMRIAGSSYLLNYAELEQADWTLVFGYSEEHISRELGEMYLFRTGVSLLSIFIALMLVHVISRGMTRNIVKLRDAMKQVEQGDFQVQVTISGKDEIGFLGHSFNEMVRNIDELHRNLYLKEIAARDAQIMALQARINPHFFFNTMETVDSLAMAGENELVIQMVRSLCQNFSYAMRSDSVVSLKEELDHVEAFMKIMKIRHMEKIRMDIEVDPEYLDAGIPRLTLQPLVENAISHGLLRKKGMGIIRIMEGGRNSSGEYFEVVVEDNGVGIPSTVLEELNDSLKTVSKHEQRSHIGLGNVNNRLKYILGDDCGIYLESEEGKYCRIHLRLTVKDWGEYVKKENNRIYSDAVGGGIDGMR